MSRKIGRNDLCPCGSGKKYKKCCYVRTNAANHHDLNDTPRSLPHYDEIDYGIPRLDEDFFQNNTVHDVSAPRMVYSCLLQPEVERVASRISNTLLDRGRQEAQLIDNTDEAGELIEIMNQEVDPLNHERLKDKLLRLKESSIPRIISELKRPKRAGLVELSVRILHASGFNCSKDILEILRHHQIGSYAISLLCMLLGFYEDESSEKLLWDYYHYLREHFPNETSSDGPLLGLIEIRERRSSKVPSQTYH